MTYLPNRRSFLIAGGLTALAATKAFGANDRLRIGVIGAGGRMRQLLNSAENSGVPFEIVSVSDVYTPRRDEVKTRVSAMNATTCMDYSQVLDDKSIDAVIIATPDHWHTHIALLACQAGKDVYVEKPLSQTIREGQMIRDAARKYKRVVQVGTQRRSAEHFASASDYVASGALGKVCLVKAWMCQVRTSIGNPPDQDPPATVNYDMWLGPAPKRAFNPNRFHYNWRFFWDYGNTELGNQGVHVLDAAMMGIQKIRKTEHVLPKRISGHGSIYWLNDAKEVPDTQVMTYDFGDLLLTWELRSFSDHDAIEGTVAGTGFYGTEGALIVDGNGWKVIGKKGEVQKQVKDSGGSHEGNFLSCVKSRQKPNADVELGRLSTTLCHLGNVAQRLGREVTFDPATETFGGDEAANAMLTKQYRTGWALPKV
jgi:predicted dehydrogenase